MELSEKIKEHFLYPKNVGKIEDAEASGTISNPVCGDMTVLSFKIRDGVVEDAKFLSYGCAVTIASASVFTELVKGRQIIPLLSGSDEEVASRLVRLVEDELGDIPTPKLHCPPATVQAFLDAVLEYFDKEGDARLGSRIKGITLHISDYYKRGRSAEE